MAGGRGTKPTSSQTTVSEGSLIDNLSVNNNKSVNNTDSESEVERDNNDKTVDLKPSAWRHMEELINTQVSITVEKQTKQINDRIDNLGSRIEGIRDNYEATIKEIRDKLTDPDLKTDEAQNLRLTAVETEVKMINELTTERNRCEDFLNYHHLIAGVSREQRSREWSIRVYNWQSPWLSTQMDAEGVYNELIKPVLDKVVAAGGSPAYPTGYHSCIEKAHPLAQRKKGITPFIFRFFSRRILYDFMLHKRDHVESLIAKAADKSLWSTASAVKYDPKNKLRVSHDLAPTNRQCMSFLHLSGLAWKCKATSVGVSFKPKGLKTGWVKVTNPFSSTLEGLVTPLPKVSSLLAAKSIIFETLEAANRDSFIKSLNINVEAIYRAATAKQSSDHDPEDEDEEEDTLEAADHPPRREETRAGVQAVPAPAAAAKGKRQTQQSTVTRSETAKKSTTTATKK
jgi:hypothetical protein